MCVWLPPQQKKATPGLTPPHPPQLTHNPHPKKQLTFSKEYTAAVEAKQVAQQEAERAKFVVEKALQDKQSAVVRAQVRPLSFFSCFVFRIFSSFSPSFCSSSRLFAPRKTAPASRRHHPYFSPFLSHPQQQQPNNNNKKQGEAQSARLIGQALASNPAFLSLRRIEAAREIAATVASSANRVFLSADSLLLNLEAVGVANAGAAARK